jgi:hypothetical protein
MNIAVSLPNWYLHRLQSSVRRLIQFIPSSAQSETVSSILDQIPTYLEPARALEYPHLGGDSVSAYSDEQNLNSAS